VSGHFSGCQMRNTEIEVEKEAFLPPREAFLLPREAILPFLTILSPGCKIALLVLTVGIEVLFITFTHSK